MMMIEMICKCLNFQYESDSDFQVCLLIEMYYLHFNLQATVLQLRYLSRHYRIGGTLRGESWLPLLGITKIGDSR